jgi:hypothetical protein
MIILNDACNGADPWYDPSVGTGFRQGGCRCWREQARCKKPADREQHAQRHSFSTGFERSTSYRGLLCPGSKAWMCVRRPIGSERGIRTVPRLGNQAPSTGPSYWALAHVVPDSMSSQIRNERNDYYDILERTQKNILDITPWMQWFLGCLDRACDGAEATLVSVLRKARFWEVHAGESFNDRLRKVVNRLLDGFEGKLTSSKWAKLAKCSQDTARRDIGALVKRGILAKDAAGGRSTS